MVIAIPLNVYPLSNVTPFTYRDGYTYLEALEDLRARMIEVIAADTAQNAAYVILVTEVNAAIEAFTNGVSADYSAFIADIEARYAVILSSLIGYTIEVTADHYTASMLDGSTFTAYTDEGVDTRLETKLDVAVSEARNVVVNTAFEDMADTVALRALITDVARDYASYENSLGAPVLQQSTMFDRIDRLGVVSGGDLTPKGAVEFYSQLGSMIHDTVLLIHGHADLHFSRAKSNRAQLCTIVGVPTGGTFTLTYAGATTAPIAWNAPGSAVIAALVALPGLAGTTVVVMSATGFAPPAGGPWTISLTDPDPQLITGSGAGLTGGTAPTVTVAQTVPDGYAYFDVPINGNIPVVGSILGVRSTGHLQFQLGETGGAYDFLDAAGFPILKVNNSGVLTLGIGGGGSLVMSGNADMPRIFGGGTALTLGLFGSNGAANTSGKIIFRDNIIDNTSAFQVDTAKTINALQTAIAVRVNNGTTTALQFVSLGAVDSAGTGFRSLRVPN